MNIKIPYEIYSIKDIDIKDKKDARVIEFLQHFYSAFIVINTKPLVKEYSLYRCSFYAGSDGWQKFTNTGYRSIYFTIKNEKELQDNEKIKLLFLEELKNYKFEFKKEIQTKLFT